MRIGYIICTSLCLLLGGVAFAQRPGPPQCEYCDPLGEGKRLVETVSGTQTVWSGWVDEKCLPLRSETTLDFHPGSREEFGETWNFSPLGTIHDTKVFDKGNLMISVWTSKEHGQAQGRITCSEMWWNPFTGREIGQIFKIVGTIDQPFEAPLFPDLSLYDSAWSGYWTVARLGKSIDPRHGEYVSRIECEITGALYVKPKKREAPTGQE